MSLAMDTTFKNANLIPFSHTANIHQTSEKSPVEVLGERFLKPVIDKVAFSAKEVMKFIGGTFASIDEKLSSPTVKASDIGLIGYFEGSCPQGWEDYLNGQERFIFGASRSYAVGAKGGEFTHTLSLNEMPAHHHLMFAGGSRVDYSASTYIKGGAAVGGGGMVNANFEYQMQGTLSEPTVGKTKTSGSGTAHNNMPPYLVLRACKKTQKSADITTLETDVAALKQTTPVGVENRVTTLEIKHQQEITALETKYDKEVKDLKTETEKHQLIHDSEIEILKEQLAKQDIAHKLRIRDRKVTIWQVIADTFAPASYEPIIIQ